MDRSRKVPISECSEVYGSDGKHMGRVEMVGARYLTISAGVFGQRSFHVPLGSVARTDAERVELAVSAVDACAEALRGNPPPDEPIYGEPDAIPSEERDAVGIPTPERETFGL